MKHLLVTVFCILLLLAAFTACDGGEGLSSSQAESESQSPAPVVCKHVGGEWIVETAPTCIESGLRLRNCLLCDNMIDAELVPAIGHSFAHYAPNNDATCTEDGTKTAACDNRCGATDTVTDEGTATGHSFAHYAPNNDATCTEDGTKTAACDNRCGATDTVTDEGTATGHSFTDYRKNNDATCTEDGTKTAVCDNRCGATDTVTDEGTATGHSFANYAPNNDATCTEDGTKTAACDNRCGATDTVIDEGTATGHSFANYAPNNDATCTEDGTKTAACDNGCGATDTVTDEGSVTPHAYLWQIGIEATCESAGEMQMTCTACGVVSNRLPIAATGHTYGSPSSDGNGKHIEVCRDCGETKAMDCTVTLVSTSGATCSKPITKTYECTVCGFTDIESVGSPDPSLHVYQEKVVKAATCTENGVGKLVCICGKLGGYFLIPAAHAWSEVIVKTPATCQETGTGVYACSVCERTVERELPALGHCYGAAVSDQNGKHTAVCSACADVATADCIYTVGEVRPATCTRVEETVYVCAACEHSYAMESGSVLDPYNHSWERVTLKPATCTEKGIGKLVCACGSTKEYYTIPAAHAWGDGASCTVCGERKPSDEE